MEKRGCLYNENRFSSSYGVSRSNAGCHSPARFAPTSEIGSLPAQPRLVSEFISNKRVREWLSSWRMCGSFLVSFPFLRQRNNSFTYFLPLASQEISLTYPCKVRKFCKRFWYIKTQLYLPRNVSELAFQVLINSCIYYAIDATGKSVFLHIVYDDNFWKEQLDILMLREK